MSRKILAALFTVSILFWILPAWAGDLDPEVEAQLAALPSGGMLSVIIEMTDQEDPMTAAAIGPGYARHARIRAMKQSLQSRANRSQRAIRKFLARERGQGTVLQTIPLWIFNGLAVTATEPVIRQLAVWPEVRKVRPDKRIPRPLPAPAAASSVTGSSEWNVAQIRAPEVWALDPNYTGLGTVVGSFDTGVDLNHPDLATRYRGDHAISWFDPYGEHESPYDFDGHGTHTTGTAVGGDTGGTGIGVAPGAQWIAAKAWNDAGFGFTSAFHQIFQWFLAPGGDPANAPDVINASWAFSTGGCLTEFLADIQALRAAGIFPAFASGNSGPLPGSVLSPGAYTESFAVGATDISDNIASFSGRGPSPCDGLVKPNVSAPGVSVLSSVPGGWVAFSGTSMAAPHVAGAVAVLRSINPALTVDELESALVEGAVDLGTPGPDNSFGVGRLDLFQSAQIILGGAGQPIVSIAATDPSAAEAGLATGTFTVSRTGSTETAATVSYAVSGTATPGADYVALSGSVTIPAGAANATIIVTPIDDSLVENDETVVVTLSADAAYIVGNPGSATVTITSDEIPADLVIATFSTPFTAGAGATISVGDTTKNQGGGSAGASTTKFYLSTNNLLDVGDVLVGSRAVPSLATGASNSGSTAVAIPSGTAGGTYYLIAEVDGDDAVVESEEGNNTNARLIQIGADLMIYSLSVPFTVGAGATISVSDTTRNQGGGSAGASTTKFYLSANTTLEAADVLLGSRAVPALAAGSTDTNSTTLTIPAGTATGSYYLIAQADGDGAVAETQESNNVNARLIQIGADLVIHSFSVPFTVGVGATISVTDATKNQGGDSVGASTTQFYLSTNNILDAGDALLASRAVPALAAGSTDTSSTTLTIPAGTATGSYYLIAQADGDNAVAETQEGNNTSARFIQIGSDLVIASFSAPAAAEVGATISVSDTTKNQGGGSVGASATKFYLSTNSLLDPGDVLLGSRAVPALAAGATDTGSTALTIPAGTATGGYYLIAQVDGDNAVAETQEGNNTNARFIQIGPDLMIYSLSVPSTVGPGATISVSDTTKNQGGEPAGASTTRFYLSTNTTLDAGDVLLGSRSVPTLPSGATQAGSTTLTMPAGTTSGNYYLIAQADGDNAVAETQEGNNVNARFIQIAQVGSDLVIASFSAPLAAGAGITISLTDTTRNQGDGSTGASVTKFYLSSNITVDAGDVLLASRAVPALAAGASSSGSTTVTIPAGTATGSYYLIAHADGDSAIAETQEGNNTSARFIQIGPDLTIYSLFAPSSPTGTTIWVTDNTRNQGGESTGATTTRFYFSTNITLDAGDILLGSRAVPALAPGTSSSGFTNLTIPAGTATGGYYLIAQADGDNAVAETQEGNNTSARFIQIGPDLVIWGFSAPFAAGAGAIISVTDTIRNQGGGSAAASATKFYLSSNSIVDAGDTVLGSRAVSPVAVGATDTGSTTLTIPAGTATGSYYLIAQADGDNAVAETQEGNNTNARFIQIGPDLMIYSLSVPFTVEAGTTISVTATTKNQGGDSAGASTTKFYLSTNSLLDAGDTPLGSRAVPALGAGVTNTGSTSLAIPAGTAAGGYYLLAQADGDNAVAETQEGNNVNARFIQISSGP